MKISRKPRAIRLLGLIIILLGFRVLIIGTSAYSDKTLIDNIKDNGYKIYGILEYIDCKDTRVGIFDIEGYIERVELNGDCAKYKVGDRILFYGYKKRYVIQGYFISPLRIFLPILGGIFLILVGYLIIRKNSK